MRIFNPGTVQARHLTCGTVNTQSGSPQHGPGRCLTAAATVAPADSEPVSHTGRSHLGTNAGTSDSLREMIP